MPHRWAFWTVSGLASRTTNASFRPFGGSGSCRDGFLVRTAGAGVKAQPGPSNIAHKRSPNATECLLFIDLSPTSARDQHTFPLYFWRMVSSLNATVSMLVVVVNPFLLASAPCQIIAVTAELGMAYPWYWNSHFRVANPPHLDDFFAFGAPWLQHDTMCHRPSTTRSHRGDD